MSNKIERIIARLQRRIAEGQPEEQYEAAQETRLVAARYSKQGNWAAAVDILASVSQTLLRSGQGGSGGDLAVLLVDTFRQAGQRVDGASRGKLLGCLRLFQPGEPVRKRFVKEMIDWSKKFGDYPAGDPELHHVVGTLYVEEGEFEAAEKHLVLGTKESPEVLARMEYEWYKQDESHTAPLYCARAVLPYLLVANVRAANTAYRIFTSALVEDNKGLTVQNIGSQSAELRIFPSLPLLNFISMLLLSVQKGSPDLFRQLKSKYEANLNELNGIWDTALELIAEMYFGIQRPRQSNPLLDMMGSLFGGGGGAPSKAALRRIDTPAAEGLD